jgi:hypothetical protein
VWATAVAGAWRPIMASPDRCRSSERCWRAVPCPVRDRQSEDFITFRLPGRTRLNAGAVKSNISRIAARLLGYVGVAGAMHLGAMMRSAAAASVARARPPRSSKAFENRSYAICLGPLIEFAVNCDWSRPPILDGYVYLECFRHCEYERDVSERLMSKAQFGLQ